MRDFKSIQSQQTDDSGKGGLFASLKSRLAVLKLDKFQNLSHAKKRAVVTGVAAVAFAAVGGPSTLALANADHTEPVTAQEASYRTADSAEGGQGAEVAAEVEKAKEKAEEEKKDAKSDEKKEKAAEKKEDVVLHGVAGLNDEQLENAVTIVETGREMGISERGQAVALATAMQEAKMYNAPSDAVPESYQYTDSSVSYTDHDSVGIFQQRTSMGWGSVEELMDVETSAKKFYGSLEKVGGWEDMSVSGAAQAVQRSAFPDAYAQWESMAHDVVSAYNKAS
ncbi:hypothetical protein [Salininema proteolyticum]|uniref:Mannosyl-glycoprotein endo-beta-N-acetylglucosaminidase n=1 Tax=Salininema proteolyticum TaxID=1607685 RepID=A0ABV8TZZ6_9ACTN